MLGRVCRLSGCDREQACNRTICTYHRTLQSRDSRARRPCTVSGCDKGQFSRGWCAAHYRRWHRHADVNELRKYPNGTGVGYTMKSGYRVLYRGERKILEHRVVMERAIGRALMTSENVHHKNGDRSDNRLENLELWVTSQPPGQRPEDLVAHALEILARYSDSSCEGSGDDVGA